MLYKAKVLLFIFILHLYTGVSHTLQEISTYFQFMCLWGIFLFQNLTSQNFFIVTTCEINIIWAFVLDLWDWMNTYLILNGCDLYNFFSLISH